MKKIHYCLLALSLTLGMLLPGCKGSNKPTSSKPSSEDIVRPTEVAGANKNITLDVYTQNTTQINPSDYINSNGLNDLTYSLAVADTNVATSAKENNIFVLTPAGVGNTTSTLSALQGSESLLDVILSISVVSTAPGAPVFSGSTFNYDRAVGGKFELPVEMNRGIASLLRVDGDRVIESNWNINEETHCLEIKEPFMLSIAKGEHSVTLVTTGGSGSFTLNVMNSIPTSFDENPNKEARLGVDKFISFDLKLNEAEIVGLKYGDVDVPSEHYVVEENSLKVKSSFYSHTLGSDERTYKLYLSNNDFYEFTINVSNQIFFSDYDLTTIHDDLQNSFGQNSLYQDSTVVSIENAPEGSGMSGKVLKFSPHSEDVVYDCHGVYTLLDSRLSATWKTVPLEDNKYYSFSFDYMTVGTTAGEDFAFKSWDGTIKKLLDTGKPGQLQHFDCLFQWDVSKSGIFVFGKFLHGGDIYFDNVSLCKVGDNEMSLSAPNYINEASFIATLKLDGNTLDSVKIDGTPVEYTLTGNDLSIATEIIKALDYGTHHLTAETEVFNLDATFEYMQAGIFETAKTYNIGIEQIKLQGSFPAGMYVEIAYRQGANNLDWINGISTGGGWQQCSASYFEVVSDGLIVKKGILDQVYQTCTFSIYYNNGAENVFTLTSDAHWFCNFDETMTWHSSLAEPQAVCEVVNNVEGMTGKCIKVTASVVDWYHRVFCFQNNGTDWAWNTWELDNNKNYEITFDFKVEMNGDTHDLNTYLGWYYFIQNHHETAFGIDYTDGAVHQMRITFAGSDCEGFAIGLDPRMGQIQSSIYIDNFRVKEVH